MDSGRDGDPAGIDANRPRRRVREVYDEIAAHFSKTRAYPWPEVEEFLDGLASDTEKVGRGETATGPRSVGLDIGCGNGRHAGGLAAITDRVVALDVSHELLTEARARMAAAGWCGELLQGDASALPLSSGSVDVALYVATLHHLPDRETRVDSLAELSRVLADDRPALVSAWSTTHDRFDDPGASGGFDTTIDWTLPGGETVPRFYHIYAPEEFEADLRAGGLAVENAFVSSGNCYAVVSPTE
jgi:ubiquinone/menaquinone biosynthesis C-methylase UbiE